jgi:hypothetical protein
MNSLLLLLLALTTTPEPSAPVPAVISQANTSIGSSFTEKQLDRYVAAVSAIEKRRGDILRRAKNTDYWTATVQLANSSNRDICSLPSHQQPDEIRNLCRELLEFSEQEIRRHGFTNREFNQITLAQQQDRKLQARIQQRLIRRMIP